MSDELREQIADVQHEIWSHWMRYLFICCHDIGNTGQVVIPADKAERWKRQMGTPYAELSDRERESDRHQADKVLAVVAPALAAATARVEAYEQLETRCKSDHRHATIHDAYMCDLATQRAETAEAALAVVPDYAAYYADAWEAWGPGDFAPMGFAEWLVASKPEVQP